MKKKWKIASIVMVNLTVVNLLPIDELAKITRILPDNLISDRAEIQMIDQGIRRIIRRNARSGERDDKSNSDPNERIVSSDYSHVRKRSAYANILTLENYLIRNTN